MKHEPNVTANALALTTAVVYVICRILVSVFPDSMIQIAQSWFHTIGLNTLSGWNLSAGSFILGLVSSSLSAWLIGYIFASFYNYFLKKK